MYLYGHGPRHHDIDLTMTHAEAKGRFHDLL